MHGISLTVTRESIAMPTTEPARLSGLSGCITSLFSPLPPRRHATASGRELETTGWGNIRRSFLQEYSFSGNRTESAPSCRACPCSLSAPVYHPAAAQGTKGPLQWKLVSGVARIYDSPPLSPCSWINSTAGGLTGKHETKSSTARKGKVVENRGEI